MLLSRIHRLDQSQVKRIILGPTPMGRITDGFDRDLKNAFGDDSFRRDICESVLAGESIAGLKVPPKVRDMICDSVTGNLPSLGNHKLLNVPKLLNRFPSLMLATQAEDALFEKLLNEIISRDMSQSDLEQVLVSLSRLRLTHQCKLQPIVRFFQKLGEEGGNGFGILQAAAEVLPREILAQRDVRKVCVDVLKGVVLHKGDLPVGQLLTVVSKLPVWPDVSEPVEMYFQGKTPATGEESLSSVIACVFMDHPTGVEWFQAMNTGDQMMVLERVADALLKRGRMCSERKNCVLRIPFENFPWTAKSLAGYLAVANQAPEGIKDLLKRYGGVADGDIVSVLISQLIRLGVDNDVLREYIAGQTLNMTPRHAKLIGYFLRDACDDLKQVLVENVSTSDPVVLSHLLTAAPNEKLSNHLTPLLEKEPLTSLIRIEKILSRNGLVYADPALIGGPLDMAIRQVRKRVFRTVRMAPINSV